jgi:hypothetical protein
MCTGFRFCSKQVRTLTATSTRFSFKTGERSQMSATTAQLGTAGPYVSRLDAKMANKSIVHGHLYVVLEHATTKISDQQSAIAAVHSLFCYTDKTGQR